MHQTGRYELHMAAVLCTDYYGASQIELLPPLIPLN